MSSDAASGGGGGAETPSASPVRVTVHVYDHIRDELGQSRLTQDLPAGSTVADLFARLAVETHPLFGQLTDDDSGLFGVNLLVLNGEQLRFPRDTQRVLPSEAELHMIPPISGG